MYLEKQRRLIIWNGGSIIKMELLLITHNAISLTHYQCKGNLFQSISDVYYSLLETHELL